jgi:hypothetical protein
MVTESQAKELWHELLPIGEFLYSVREFFWRFPDLAKFGGIGKTLNDEAERLSKRLLEIASELKAMDIGKRNLDGEEYQVYRFGIPEYNDGGFDIRVRRDYEYPPEYDSDPDYDDEDFDESKLPPYSEKVKKSYFDFIFRENELYFGVRLPYGSTSFLLEEFGND